MQTLILQSLTLDFFVSITLRMEFTINIPLSQSSIIRLPKVPFRVFDKLKNKIQKFMVIFSFYLNMKTEIQIIDYYFHIKKNIYFKFLMLSFVFNFHKKWKTKYSSVLVIHFHEGIEKQIT